MTRKEIRSLSGEDFLVLSLEEKLEAIKEELDSYNYHKAWIEKYNCMNKRSWEYRQHKAFMIGSKCRLETWINSTMGAENGNH